MAKSLLLSSETNPLLLGVVDDSQEEHLEEVEEIPGDVLLLSSDYKDD